MRLPCGKSAVSRSVAGRRASGAALVCPGKAHELCCVRFPHSSTRSLLEKVEQETWRETGISFVTSVTRLMERLLDYRYRLTHPGLFSGQGTLPTKGTFCP